VQSDPEYGTEADLKALVEEAHKLDLESHPGRGLLPYGAGQRPDGDSGDVHEDKNGQILLGTGAASARLRESENEGLFQAEPSSLGESGGGGRLSMRCVHGVPLSFWEESRAELDKINREHHSHRRVKARRS